MSDGLNVEDVELLTDEIADEASLAAGATTGTEQRASRSAAGRVFKRVAWIGLMAACGVLIFPPAPVQSVLNNVRAQVAAAIDGSAPPVSISLLETEAKPSVITGGDRAAGDDKVVQNAPLPTTSRSWKAEQSRLPKPGEDAMQKVASLDDSAGVSVGQGRGLRVDLTGGASADGMQRLAADYKPNGAGGIQVEQVEAAPRKSLKLDTGSDATRMVVPVGEGRLLRFDEDVTSVYIADPSVADVKVVTPTQVYVFGKRAGETNLLAVSDNKRAPGEPGLTASLKIFVSAAPQANDAMGASPLQYRFQNNRLVIEGHGTIDQGVRAYEAGRSYTNQEPVDMAGLVGSNQVNIRVRFAEISRSDMQGLGIDWGFKASAGSFSLGIKKTTSDGLTPNLSSSGGSSGNFSNIEVLLEALQRNGMVNILAEPNLTAVTGETASFLAGGEVAIPIATGNANNSLGVGYKSFGVSLQFTPTILRNNRIGLRVKPEVSSVAATGYSANGVTLPNFTVRRTETTVEVGSGETFAIAGLFQRETSRSVEKFPLLGDVPVLGALFQSERFKRNETELVILITPYLVTPVRDKSLATPLDRQGHNQPWKDRKAPGTAPDKEVIRERIAAPDKEQSGFVFK